MGALDVFRSQGRDPGRATLMARGTVFLATVGLVLGALLLVGRGSFTDATDAVVRVDDAGGSLVTGADVKYDGVIVGEVTSLSSDGDGVELGVALDPTLADEVPGDVQARILPASVFGTSFIDLVSSDPGSPGLRAGQVIAQDRSRETLEVQAVLDGLDRVVGALGPARLSRALEGLAGALDGNGEQLGRSIVRIRGYLAKLNPQMPALRRNLTLLATNLEAFEGYAPDLFRATEDVLVTARTLVESENDFAGLVTSGSRTFRQTDRLLERNREALVDTLVRTAVVVDTLYDGRRGVVQGLLEALRLGERFREALGHGRYLRIDGNLVVEGDEPYGRDQCPRFGTHDGRGC